MGTENTCLTKILRNEIIWEWDCCSLWLEPILNDGEIEAADRKLGKMVTKMVTYITRPLMYANSVKTKEKKQKEIF